MKLKLMVLFTQPFVLSVMQNIQVQSTVCWIDHANFLKLTVDWKCLIGSSI